MSSCSRLFCSPQVLVRGLGVPGRLCGRIRRRIVLCQDPRHARSRDGRCGVHVCRIGSRHWANWLFPIRVLLRGYRSRPTGGSFLGVRGQTESRWELSPILRFTPKPRGPPVRLRSACLSRSSQGRFALPQHRFKYPGSATRFLPSSMARMLPKSLSPITRNAPISITRTAIKRLAAQGTTAPVS